MRECTGLSRSTIYRRIQDGTFPPGYSLGGNTRAWLNGEVQAWIDARIAAHPLSVTAFVTFGDTDCI